MKRVNSKSLSSVQPTINNANYFRTYKRILAVLNSPNSLSATEAHQYKRSLGEMMREKVKREFTFSPSAQVCLCPLTSLKLAAKIQKAHSSRGPHEKRFTGNLEMIGIEAGKVVVSRGKQDQERRSAAVHTFGPNGHGGGKKVKRTQRRPRGAMNGLTAVPYQHSPGHPVWLIGVPDIYAKAGTHRGCPPAPPGGSRLPLYSKLLSIKLSPANGAQTGPIMPTLQAESVTLPTSQNNGAYRRERSRSHAKPPFS